MAAGPDGAMGPAIGADIGPDGRLGHDGDTEPADGDIGAVDGIVGVAGGRAGPDGVMGPLCCAVFFTSAVPVTALFVFDRNCSCCATEFCCCCCCVTVDVVLDPGRPPGCWFAVVSSGLEPESEPLLNP